MYLVRKCLYREISTSFEGTHNSLIPMLAAPRKVKEVFEILIVVALNSESTVPLAPGWSSELAMSPQYRWLQVGPVS